METVLVLAVVSIPVLALVGALLAIAALVRVKNLDRRLDEVERRSGLWKDHPVARRIRELDARVTALEGGNVPTGARAAEDRPPLEVGPEQVSAAEEVRPVEATPAVATPPPPTRPAPPAPPAADLSPPDGDGDASPPPVEPPAPRHRSRIEWERWIGVRGAAAAGGVVLALASLLFFQYSIEHGLISPAMRVVFGVLAGIVCLVGSEWLVRRNQAAAANALAGAGVVILYAATWAAQNLYGLIGAVPAFVLMVLVTVACVVLAVAREARFIAVLGLLGGFTTPVLVASEVDSPAALFGYVLLLDLGLLWLARARGWPLLAVLSLVGTALHQGLWIFADMDAERAGLGLVILGVFGLAFLFFGVREGERSLLWRATRAGGVAVPFAFALHFAGHAELAENPWPLASLLLVLSAGACWLELRGTRGAAVTAAAASLGVMTLWFLDRRLTAGLAWQAVTVCMALSVLFTGAAELGLRRVDDRRLGPAALVSATGFVILLAFASGAAGVVRPWPWLVSWTVLGGLLVLHARWPGRAWAQLAAGLAPAFGFFLAAGRHGLDAGGPSPWLWLALAAVVAIVWQFVAVLTTAEQARTWAERTAAATALAMMPSLAVLASLRRGDGLACVGVVGMLGLLAALAATRLRSGPWLLATSAATAFGETVIFGDCHRQLVSASADGTALILMGITSALVTLWPTVSPTAFRGSRAGWWGAALAGPFWFPVLANGYRDRFGDGTIGLVPLALGLVALIAAVRAKAQLVDTPRARRIALVWYLAVALSMVSLAIPLQLDNEWVTIGWALNGLALVALWIRLDHPGLKLFGFALLGAATVRLIANPEVLGYHVPAVFPVANWLAYTYLVPAAALLLAMWLLRPLEVERLRDWEERAYLGHRPWGSIACGLAAVAVVFVWINLAIADAFATGNALRLSLERLPARDATTSVAWAGYALILLAIGVRSRSGAPRWLSLGLLVLTLGKVFLHDLGELEDLYRVASLVGLAVSLIVVSLIYQRFVFRSATGEDT